MDEVLRQLGWMSPMNNWGKPPTSWCVPDFVSPHPCKKKLDPSGACWFEDLDSLAPRLYAAAGAAVQAGSFFGTVAARRLPSAWVFTFWVLLQLHFAKVSRELPWKETCRICSQQVLVSMLRSPLPLTTTIPACAVRPRPLCTRTPFLLPRHSQFDVLGAE